MSRVQLEAGAGIASNRCCPASLFATGGRIVALKKTRLNFSSLSFCLKKNDGVAASGVSLQLGKDASSKRGRFVTSPRLVWTMHACVHSFGIGDTSSYCS
ncbi:hypothetical protein BS78_10G073400 [Paspalum vaginatum]|nr:hypothetical protein BS78_10G073400 [Paspalum vaginatum]